MIELPNGKVARTLPEQVGHLTKEIENIWNFIDGINVQDNLVKVAAASGTLTAKEMEIVSRSVAFIEYNSNLYVKANTTATEFIFKQIALSASDQGTYNILQSFRIVITKASGAYAYSSNTVLSLYNKTEMDTLLAAKANASDLAAKANLSGANFTGAITAPSIIEDMSGYSFIAPTTSEPVIQTTIYAGVVKNGNKLTFALFQKIVVTSTPVGNYLTLGAFSIPSAVLAKLYPTTIGGVDFLDNRTVSLFKSLSSALDMKAYCQKGGTGITLAMHGLQSIPQNEDYYVRYELTFLLSDNLAS